VVLLGLALLEAWTGLRLLALVFLLLLGGFLVEILQTPARRSSASATKCQPSFVHLESRSPHAVLV
jgi:hypothetical protein